MIAIRQQEDAQRALKDVMSVSIQPPEDKEETSKAAQERLSKEKKLRKNYQQLWMKFPMLVMRNGLLQTLSYYEYKFIDEDHGKKFFAHFNGSLGFVRQSDWKGQLREGDLQSYMEFTDRALEVAVWYKHFVNSQFNLDEPEVQDADL